MPGKSRMVQSGIMLVLILAMTGLDWSYGAAAADQGPDQAMRSFIDAVVRKDKSAILSSFSPSSPWQYVGYEIGTGKVIATKTVNYQVMAKDFASQKGWYGFFFHEPNGYTFRINFRQARCGRKKARIPLFVPRAIRATPMSPGGKKEESGSFRKSARPGPNRLSDLKLPRPLHSFPSSSLGTPVFPEAPASER